MQVIFPNVGNMPVQLLDLLDLLTPVTRKLHLLCKGTLQSCEFLLGLHESIDRHYVVTIRQGNHLLYSEIDPYCLHGRVYRVCYFSLRLD